MLQRPFSLKHLVCAVEKIFMHDLSYLEGSAKQDAPPIKSHFTQSLRYSVICVTAYCMQDLCNDNIQANPCKIMLVLWHYFLCLPGLCAQESWWEAQGYGWLTLIITLKQHERSLAEFHLSLLSKGVLDILLFTLAHAWDQFMGIHLSCCFCYIIVL